MCVCAHARTHMVHVKVVKETRGEKGVIGSTIHLCGCREPNSNPLKVPSLQSLKLFPFKTGLNKSPVPSWVWWCEPLIPALRRKRQENLREFPDSKVVTKKPCLGKGKKGRKGQGISPQVHWSLNFTAHREEDTNLAHGLHIQGVYRATRKIKPLSHKSQNFVDSTEMVTFNFNPSSWDRLVYKVQGQPGLNMILPPNK